MKIAGFLFAGPAPLQAFAEACLRFSPQICLREPNAVLVEIGRSHRIYSDAGFVARAKALLRRFDLTAEIAIAPSIAHALAAAEYPHRLVAQMPLSSLWTFFDPLNRGQKKEKSMHAMIHALTQVGMTTVGDFLNLPAHELPSRFGQSGVICRQRILQQIHTQWPAWQPAESIGERVDLGYEAYASEVDRLLFSVKPLMDRVFCRLRPRALKITSLNLRFEFERFRSMNNHTRDFRFEFLLPQSSALALHPILRERLHRDFGQHPIQTPVTSIQLDVLQTVRSHEGQRNLFHSFEDQQEQMNAIVAQLAESLGKNNVFRAQVAETRIAEKSWSRAIEEQKSFPDLKRHLPLRPTNLLARPERVQVTASSIFIRNHRYRITRWSEVEKVSAEWLDELINRNYFKIDIEGKPAVWVFQTESDEYFLHGCFE